MLPKKGKNDTAFKVIDVISNTVLNIGIQTKQHNAYRKFYPYNK